MVVLKSQSASHKKLLKRLEETSLSPEGELVRDYIRFCGTHFQGLKPQRCGYHLCPTCGAEQKFNLSAKFKRRVDHMISIVGHDHVSAVTLDHDWTTPNQVAGSVKDFRKVLRNSFYQNLPRSYLFGEFDIAPTVLEEELDHTVCGIVRAGSQCDQDVKSASEQLGTCEKYLLSSLVTEQELTCFENQFEGDAVSIVERNACGVSGFLKTKVGEAQVNSFDNGASIVTASSQPPRGVMVHVHAVMTHPEMPRGQVRDVLKRSFPAHKAVKITPIKDVVRDGRLLNGANRWGEYVHDKSSGVKGRARWLEGIYIENQAMVFDAFALLSGGTRRRPSLTIKAHGNGAINW